MVKHKPCEGLSSCMVNYPIFGVYGHSDSGKTTLVVKLVTQLTKEGYRVATVKQTKKSISLDVNGKDTWRHHAAGAELAVFSAASETDFLLSTPMSMSEIVQVIAEFGCYDLVVVEGAHDPDLPKIQIGGGRKRKHTVVRYENNFEEILSIIKKEIKMKQSFQKLNIVVNGENIPLTEFPEHILTNTFFGMLSSLKGVKNIKNFTINYKK
jgi:molybdopterin-guanine dinucleotide biosynthesis adapter protein